MTGEARQDNRDSSFNQRNFSDRSRRGRGNTNRSETRGNRQKNDFRGRNSRGNFENKREFGSYTGYRNQQQSEETSQQARVPKFDANKLSDPNEFPALNDMSSQTRNSRNSKRLEENISSQNVSNETKKFNWRGQGQNMFRKNHEGTYMDNRNQHIPKHTNDGVTTPNYERNYDNSNRGNRGNYQYNNNRGGRNNRRVTDGSRRNTRGSNIQPANFEVMPQYEAAPLAEEPIIWYKYPALSVGHKIVSPPSMEGHEECMPGDSKQDHDECHYYKTRVNDDTLDNTIRVRSQLEFYFSNFNLKTDTYLRDMMDVEGFVSMDKILDFNRMVKLKTTKELLKTVVETSDKLEYDDRKEKIRRINEPQNWTSFGLLLQIIPVYMSYYINPNFTKWYFEALAYVHRLMFPNLQFTPDCDLFPPYFFCFGRNYEPTSNQFYTVVVVSYCMGANDYILIGEVRNVIIPDNYVLQTPPEPMKVEMIPNESEQPNFIEMVKSYNPPMENNKPSVEINEQINDVSLLTSELTIEEDPIHLRNTKQRKGKPTPQKYDRHSANPPKNVKQENKRDVEQQIHAGFISFDHESTKKSNSTHGSLSAHSEAAPKVFVSSALPYKKDTKENREKNITVVEGPNIVRDKNIIDEAIKKVKQGEEEPIIISTNIKKNNQVNGRRGQKDGKKPGAANKSRQEQLGTDGQSRTK